MVSLGCILRLPVHERSQLMLRVSAELRQGNCQKSQALLAIKIGILVLLHYIEIVFREEYFSG